MEDAAIETLERMAHDYADVRDDRIAKSVKEGELKKELLAEMKRQKRETYKHGRVEINLVHESETVKVKIHKASDESEETSHEYPEERSEPEPDEEEEDDFAEDEDFEETADDTVPA